MNLIETARMRAEERRALHEHMERLSCNSEDPAPYFDFDIPERFSEMYRLSIADSLIGFAFCLMLFHALTDFGKFVEKLLGR